MSLHSTVWDAVAALRATWLSPRTRLYLDPTRETGVRDANPVWVYRDGTRVGPVDVLRNVSTSDVEAVEYFDASAASLRWGINHENGVIHLTSRRGPVES